MPRKDHKSCRQKRANRRFVLLNHQLPGVLVTKTDREPVFAKVLNVSKGGLGIVLGQQLTDNNQLILVFQEQEISLSVVWSKQQGHLFRHGLKVDQPEVDLESIFFSLGLIDLKVDFEV